MSNLVSRPREWRRGELTSGAKTVSDRGKGEASEQIVMFRGTMVIESAKEK
jgi:hypothetical protein